jgi:hypothetical protein
MEALRQHLKLTVLQANIWMKCSERGMTITDIKEWGWRRVSESLVKPYWKFLYKDVQEVIFGS